jgi:phosphogluconate dehydratase
MHHLSAVVPLLARVYPNGSADINDFDRAGGMPYLVRELREGGFLNEDVTTLWGQGLDMHCHKPVAQDGGGVTWAETVTQSSRDDVLRPVTRPFSQEGGLRCLSGNLGDSVIKVSAVDSAHHHIKAPCRVFSCQEALREAFEAGELNRDVVAVVRFQGPQANGMPELHKMTPHLGSLQDEGYRVALVTDGRMSGASGKVPAAIHLSPEAAAGGPIARLRDGDLVELDAHSGCLHVLVPADEFAARPLAVAPVVEDTLGRRLFEVFRAHACAAPGGASVFDSSAAAALPDPYQTGNN